MRFRGGVGALRLGRSFVEKRGQVGKDGANLPVKIGRRCAAVGTWVRLCVSVGMLKCRRGCAVVGVGVCRGRAWAWLRVGVGCRGRCVGMVMCKRGCATVVAEGGRV